MTIFPETEIFPEAEVRGAVERLIDYHSRASQITDWTYFVDETYTEDADYICEYAGVRYTKAVGRAEIKATHYGDDMGGFEEWTFPYEGYGVNGNRIMTHWWNRGPGKRDNGEYFQCPGISLITYAGAGMFSHQYDMFDLGHQMRICDDLEDNGLLSPKLKEGWVKPMKKLLIESLQRNRD